MVCYYYLSGGFEYHPAATFVIWDFRSQSVSLAVIGEVRRNKQKGNLSRQAVRSLSTAHYFYCWDASEREQLVQAITFETVFTLIAGPWEGVALSVFSCPADEDDDDDGRSLRRGVPRLPVKDGEGVGVLRPPVPARRLSFLRL